MRHWTQRDLGTHSSNRMSSSVPSRRSQGTLSKKFPFGLSLETNSSFERQKEGHLPLKEHQGNKALQINWAKLLHIVHRDWASKYRAFLHLVPTSPLHLFYGIPECVNKWVSVFCNFGGSFPFVAFLYSNSKWSLSVFCHYVLFCYVWLLFLRCLFFSNEKQKGRGPRRKGRWGGTRKNRGMGNWNNGILYEKIKYF